MKRSVTLLAALFMSYTSLAQEGPKISEPKVYSKEEAVQICTVLASCLKEDLLVVEIEGTKDFACLTMNRKLGWALNTVPYAFAACYVIRSKEPKPA